MIDPEIREFKAAVENEYATQRLERFEESLERLMNSRDFRIVLSYWLDRWKVGKVAWDSHSYNRAKNAGMQLVGVDASLLQNLQVLCMVLARQGCALEATTIRALRPYGNAPRVASGEQANAH